MAKLNMQENTSKQINRRQKTHRYTLLCIKPFPGRLLRWACSKLLIQCKANTTAQFSQLVALNSNNNRLAVSCPNNPDLFPSPQTDIERNPIDSPRYLDSSAQLQVKAHWLLPGLLIGNTPLHSPGSEGPGRQELGGVQQIHRRTHTNRGRTAESAWKNIDGRQVVHDEDAGVAVQSFTASISSHRWSPRALQISKPAHHQLKGQGLHRRMGCMMTWRPGLILIMVN